MATHPATSRAKGATDPYRRFIVTLQRLTGLDQTTLITWVFAEHGPADNPLGIKPRGQLAHFGTPEAAAQATAQLLKSNPAYHPILAAANSPKTGPKEQLDAIIASPWDSCRYRGLDKNRKCANAKPGTLLYGVYTRAFGGPPLSGARGQRAYVADPIDIGGLAGKVVPHTDTQGTEHAGIAGIVGDVEQWLERKSLTALLYVVFTVGALALLLLALSKLVGGVPSVRGVGSSAARRLRPRPGPGEPGYFDDLAMG
ncbi:MAG TPA: hypothetical protein VGJ25_09080 [Gaiellaceae bacterium]|jgi:hypothetical protein